VLGLPWRQAVLLGRPGPRLGQVEAQLWRQRLLLQVKVSVWTGQGFWSVLCAALCPVRLSLALHTGDVKHCVSGFVLHVSKHVLRIWSKAGASGGATVEAVDSATSQGELVLHPDLCFHCR
jgi:hypothetical protein